MPRPINATIHLDAIRHNLALIKHKVAPAKVWAVVKANAYGHDIKRIFPALELADGIALLDLQEAIIVRELGWKKPILLLEGFFQPQDLYLIDQYQLTTSVHSDWQLDAIANANLKSPVTVYLKLNSGMNRLGFTPLQYQQKLTQANAIANIGEVVLMSHFSDSDVQNGIDTQMIVINEFYQLPVTRCLANSGAILWADKTHYDWVRSGIILYGVSPSGLSADIAEFGLLPAMVLKSEIIAIHHLKQGDTVGYGSRFVAPKPMRIATVACGYADGYPRHAPTGTPIWVAGKICPLIGAISMDMLTVDITEHDTANLGSEVELWGKNVPIDDVAHCAGTIGYQLLCALAARVPVTTI